MNEESLNQRLKASQAQSQQQQQRQQQQRKAQQRTTRAAAAVVRAGERLESRATEERERERTEGKEGEGCRRSVRHAVGSSEGCWGEGGGRQAVRLMMETMYSRFPSPLLSLPASLSEDLSLSLSSRVRSLERMMMTCKSDFRSTHTERQKETYTQPRHEAVSTQTHIHTHRHTGRQTERRRLTKRVSAAVHSLPPACTAAQLSFCFHSLPLFLNRKTSLFSLSLSLAFPVD